MRWRPVVGHEDTYEVSEHGDVRRIDTHELRTIQSHSAYPVITFSRNGVRETRTIACVVAAAFLGPAPKHCRVMHYDGNPRNNTVANLYYLSKKPKKHKRTTARLEPAQVNDIRHSAARGADLHDLADTYEVCISTIRDIVARRTWRWLKPVATPEDPAPIAGVVVFDTTPVSREAVEAVIRIRLAQGESALALAAEYNLSVLEILQLK